MQSDQIRILRAHGQLTTPRMLHILDHDPGALRWVPDTWLSSETEEDNIVVRQVAAEALALVVRSRISDPGL